MTSTNTRPLCPLVVFCFLWSSVLCFQPLFPLTGNSSTHLDITHRALLHKSAEVCRDLASAEGRDFSLAIDDSLTVSKVQRACSSSGSTLLSTVMFHTAIAKIFLGNAAVDAVLALSERLHFDDETFQEGRDVITAGVSAVKASVKLENFVTGRLTLGRVCHTLQDFYSHSNWVELGNKSPYGALIKPDQQLDNLAGPSVPTCRNCTDGDCTNNLLPDLMQQGLLTSGYFSLLSSAKPAGKCSHGGAFDLTSLRDPVGGINKDDTGASHGALHHQAANLAVNATVELLEDIRLAVGDKNFLQLMGLSRSSVLCFVIDTTGSMSDDIAEAKRVSFSIIDSKRGTQEEPSAYILVPFNDPGFGPLLITTDADVFKASINRLSASGGGDIPELCLSGLQLALTAAPSSSEIFVFTDAPAKDAHLKGTITALIESSKSVVTFMLTDVLASRRRRRQSQHRTPRSMSQADAQVYRDLAQASGGQAIEVTKSDLTLATSVIEDSSAPAMVTLLQAVRKPGKPDTFSFMVDGSMRNLTAYITGAPSLTFNLTSSSGVSQGSSQISGPLGTFSTVGNLRRFSLSTDNQTGLWEISINSNDPYSLKITGQSSVNFIFNVIELQDGGHRGYSLKESRPLKGGNVSLLVTVTGSDTVKITEVTLVERSGSLQVNGSVQVMGGGNYLVTFSNVPEGEFALSLRGEESATPRSRAGSSTFQRQSPTQLKTSSISISAQANTTAVEPGSTISVPFTVSAAAADGTVNASATGTYAVSVSNDQGYTSSAPATVTLGDGGTANGTVELTVPGTAASGSAVTLTLEAAKDSDVNYAVLRMSVEAKVTDFSGPVCQVISISDTCPSSAAVCSSAQWQFSAQLSDGANGTGISSISVGEGNGTLNTSNQVGAAGENVTMVTFSASCCAQTVELVAVDAVGNVGKCEGRAILKEATTLSPAVTTAAVPTASTGWRPLTLPRLMWIGVAVSLLWR